MRILTLTTILLLGVFMHAHGSEVAIKGVHVTVYVRDLELSKVVYEKILGIPPTYSLENEYGFVLNSGISINIERWSDASLPHNVFVTLAISNIDEKFKRLKDSGIKIVSNPTRAADGHAIIGVIEDGDGNRIVFAE
jgi:predicted enzyme related to lactoylglutathione lyase